MKLNFSEIMENIRRFLVWFLIALAICRNLKCEENVAGDLSGAQSYGIESSIDYTQLDCEYNMDTGDKICDCRNRNEIFVLQSIRGNVNNIIVENCNTLIVKSHTFEAVDYIDHIQFRNIKQLILESNSLAFVKRLPIPKIKLLFSNVNFDEITTYSMNGYIDSIAFTNCRIDRFSAYAINSIQEAVYRISFENTVINTIESQALKRLQIEHFLMRNVIFRSHLPSRTLTALTITNDISISNCTFATISSQAIELNNVNDFSFSDNQVGRMDAEAFQINANGRILFERNNFSYISRSALSGIHVGEKAKQKKMEIQFLSNTIVSTDYPIYFEVDQNLYLRILDLKFTKTTDCNEAKHFRHNNFLQKYADSIYFKNGKDLEFTSLSSILSNKCVETTYIIAIISIVAVVVLLLVIGAVAIFYRYWMKHKPNQQNNMVIPDGKTYRETQIMFQIEHVDLLKTNL